MLARYRRTGADLPFSDQRRAHGVPFEGYYWRFHAPGWSVAVIAGVCRDWAMVTLAGEPGGFERTRIAEPASAAADGLGVVAGTLLRADAASLRVDLGPGARLSAALDARREWPRRPFGALGPAQVVPWLGQYWTPWLLGARVRGEADVGRTVSLDGAQVYAEKNWGGAFAAHWWWGQAPGIAFAGGRVHGAAPTSVVAWTPEGLVTLAPPLARTLASAGGGAWHVRARSPRWTVEIEGEARTPPLRLAVPLPAERSLEVRSSHHLLARAQYSVRRGRRVWLRGEGEAALEDGASAAPPAGPRG